MQEQRNLYVLVGSLIGCLAILICVALLALVGVGVLSNSTLFVRTVDRIAYMDNVMNVHVIDPRGENRIALTTDATEQNALAYHFPTWSPDSQRVAFLRVIDTRSTREGIVFVASSEGGNLATVFKSDSEFPFYLYWAPDGEKIAFLTQSNAEIALMLGDGQGKRDARKLDSGSPFYWAWSPDSRILLTHVGGSKRVSRGARMALLSWEDTSSQTLAEGPAAFQAPQFSPNGSAMLYASTAEGDQDALYSADAAGKNPRVITRYRGRIAFAWSPDGKNIAWIATPSDAELPNWGPVMVSDPNGQDQRTLSQEDALAFYWSPNSQRIAYLSLPTIGSQRLDEKGSRVPGLSAPLEQGSRARLRWRIAELGGAPVRTLVNFTPTTSFLSVVPYFDQYARSMTFWSPSSQQFVYAQREARGGSIWVIDTTEGAAPRRIADGLLAVWSWR